MPTPSNPGWATGYTPTAAQWNAEFGGKVDYPAPVSQGGTGATSAEAANYNLQQRGLISTTPFNLQALSVYGLKTSVSGLSVYLPSLASLLNGDWIRLADVDYNAATNNVTVYGNESDQIYSFGSAAGSQVLNQSGIQVLLMVNSGAWSMLV